MKIAGRIGRCGVSAARCVEAQHMRQQQQSFVFQVEVIPFIT